MRKNAETNKINEAVTGTPKLSQRRTSINIEHEKD